MNSDMGGEYKEIGQEEAVVKGGKDFSWVVYSMLFLLSLATLLPWNAFISASGYFAARLSGTAFSVNFENFFGIAFNVSNVLSQAALTYTALGQLGVRQKILYPFVLVFLVFATCAFLVLVPPSQIKGTTFFGFTILLVTICGACNAAIQAGLFGMAARLPPLTYTQSLMAGQGMGGLLPSAAAIITLASSSPSTGTPEYSDVKWSAFSYFLIASFTILAAVIGYIVLEKHPLLRKYGALDLDEAGEVGDDQDAADLMLGEPDFEPEPEDAAAQTYARIKALAWGVTVNFTITLAVFPSLTANIYSMQAKAYEDGGAIKYTANPPEGRFYGDLFVPIYCFLLFNLFDFAGRTLAGRYILIPTRWLFTASCCRVIFVPLFLLCNLVEVGESLVPVVFKHVAFPIVFMVFFAITNGYITSLEFMLAPTLVEKRLQDSAGRMMCFFASAGLLSGSMMSFPLHALICSCNPFIK